MATNAVPGSVRVVEVMFCGTSCDDGLRDAFYPIFMVCLWYIICLFTTAVLAGVLHCTFESINSYVTVWFLGFYASGELPEAQSKM